MTAHLSSPEELLLGSRLHHEVTIPAAVLAPAAANGDAQNGRVRLRPLTVGLLTLIARAAREDAGLVPLLLIKEAVIEPPLSLDQIRQMHVGLVHFLVGQINRISGLEADGSAVDSAVASPLGQSHLLLARHFGWTPEQVSHLTPGQVAVYLAGVEALLGMERRDP